MNTPNKSTKSAKNPRTSVKSNIKSGPKATATNINPKIPVAQKKRLTSLYAAPTKPASQLTAYKAQKGEAYMNPKQRKHFHKLLMQQKEQLVAQASHTVDNIRDNTANYPDVTDRAAHEENFGMELQVRKRELQLIKKIESALEYIKAGTYGYCAKCSKEIGVARLEVRPTAELCIKCKTSAEEREHSHSPS